MAFVAGAIPPAGAAPDGFVIKVEAGDYDREYVPISFALPEEARIFTGVRADEGRILPLQHISSNRACFILPSLARGQRKQLTLVPAPAPAETAVRAERNGTTIRLQSGGRSVVHYQAEKSELPRPDLAPIFRRGGYLHPVFTPSGRRVMDDYPSNHKHHHGIWFPWTKTAFEGRHPDFWNMGDGTGTVEFIGPVETWSGPVQGGLRTQHEFIDLSAPDQKTALRETWEVVVYASGPPPVRYWMFDLVSTQGCASASTLRLPQYHYGGLGFRGHWDWNGATNTFWLTSEGETNRVRGNATRGRWCHIGGVVEGGLCGVAVLGHPQNFRAPQPMRLHPTEPFFCFAPSQLGDWAIEPGKPYVSRYRFIVADGPAEAKLIDRLWNDYAHPPEVQVEAVAQTGR